MNDWAAKSFWLGATPYTENSTLEEDIRADVAIVGAGFTGLSTAYYLRQAGELREEVNSPLYVGARAEEECALVNPAKLARGMKNLAEGAGAEIYERTPVEAAHLKPRIRLETPQGSVAAQKVVFATNAFTQRFPRLHSKASPSSPTSSSRSP